MIRVSLLTVSVLATLMASYLWAAKRASSESVAELAVWTAGNDNALAAQSQAHGAVSAYPGFESSLQMQSVEDPKLFFDYVRWSSVDFAAAAAKQEEQSEACRPLFAAISSIRILGRLHSPSALATIAITPSQVVQFIHRRSPEVGEDRTTAAFIAELRRQGGFIAAEAGHFSAEDQPGTAAIILWSDLPAAKSAYAAALKSAAGQAFSADRPYTGYFAVSRRYPAATTQPAAASAR